MNLAGPIVLLAALCQTPTEDLKALLKEREELTTIHLKYRVDTLIDERQPHAVGLSTDVESWEDGPLRRADVNFSLRDGTVSRFVSVERPDGSMRMHGKMGLVWLPKEQPPYPYSASARLFGVLPKENGLGTARSSPTGYLRIFGNAQFVEEPDLQAETDGVRLVTGQLPRNQFVYWMNGGFIASCEERNTTMRHVLDNKYERFTEVAGHFPSESVYTEYDHAGKPRSQYRYTLLHVSTSEIIDPQLFEPTQLDISVGDKVVTPSQIGHWNGQEVVSKDELNYVAPTPVKWSHWRKPLVLASVVLSIGASFAAVYFVSKTPQT